MRCFFAGKRQKLRDLLLAKFACIQQNIFPGNFFFDFGILSDSRNFLIFFLFSKEHELYYNLANLEHMNLFSLLSLVVVLLS